MQNKVTRRNFIRNTIIGASLAPMIVKAQTLGLNGKISPSNKINLGFIGLSQMQGLGLNLKTFMKFKDINVKMLCDVDLKHLATAKKYLENQKYDTSAIKCVQDFREVLDSPEIDAVVISTPDHWHVTMTVMALRKGKHVFCEKPTASVDEDFILEREVAKSGLVYQSGVEDRALARRIEMIDLAKNGYLGDIETVHTGVWVRYQNTRYIEPREEKVPDYFDYDLWTGPAPMHPYQKERCHYNFRWINDYSNGELLNWGTHAFDVGQLAVTDVNEKPISVKPLGETKFAKGLFDTPYDFELEYTYASGVKIFVESGGTYLRITGSKGWIEAPAYGGVSKASSTYLKTLLLKPSDTRFRSEVMMEHRNFIDNIRFGRELFMSANIQKDMCFSLNTGFISLLTNSEIKIDKDGNYIDNPTATAMRKRTYRKPFDILNS